MWSPPQWYVVFWGGAAVIFLTTQLAQVYLLYRAAHLLYLIWRAMK